MKQPYSSICQLLEQYFDGLYFGDLNLLKQSFHPQAHYVTAVGGELEQLDMPAYFQRVANRATPASQNQPRRDQILAIEIIGPETALARVQCVIAAKHFTDLLNLICVDGQWQIISKVFHYQLHEE